MGDSPRDPTSAPCQTRPSRISSPLPSFLDDPERLSIFSRRTHSLPSAACHQNNLEPGFEKTHHHPHVTDSPYTPRRRPRPGVGSACLDESRRPLTWSACATVAPTARPQTFSFGEPDPSVPVAMYDARPSCCLGKQRTQREVPGRKVHLSLTVDSTPRFPSPPLSRCRRCSRRRRASAPRHCTRMPASPVLE